MGILSVGDLTTLPSAKCSTYPSGFPGISGREAVHLLLEYGAGVEAEDSTGRIALQVADEKEVEIMELLLESKAK